MLETLFKIFGNNLPDRHIFFATEGVPTRALLFKEFGTWVNFNNEYKRFIAKQKALVQPKPAVKAAKKPKGATNVK